MFLWTTYVFEKLLNQKSILIPRIKRFAPHDLHRNCALFKALICPETQATTGFLKVCGVFCVINKLIEYETQMFHV